MNSPYLQAKDTAKCVEAALNGLANGGRKWLSFAKKLREDGVFTNALTEDDREVVRAAIKKDLEGQPDSANRASKALARVTSYFNAAVNSVPAVAVARSGPTAASPSGQSAAVRSAPAAATAAPSASEYYEASEDD